MQEAQLSGAVPEVSATKEDGLSLETDAEASERIATQHQKDIGQGEVMSAADVIEIEKITRNLAESLATPVPDSQEKSFEIHEEVTSGIVEAQDPAHIEDISIKKTVEGDGLDDIRASIRAQLSEKAAALEVSKDVIESEPALALAEKTAGNDGLLRDIGKKYLSKSWQDNISQSGSGMTADDMRSNFNSELKYQKSDALPGLGLGGAGVGSLGIGGYALMYGGLSAVGIGLSAFVGVPALAVGGYKAYKLLSAWNKKRKGLKALKDAGY